MSAEDYIEVITAPAHDRLDLFLAATNRLGARSATSRKVSRSAGL